MSIHRDEADAEAARVSLRKFWDIGGDVSIIAMPMLVVDTLNDFVYLRDSGRVPLN